MFTTVKEVELQFRKEAKLFDMNIDISYNYFQFY